MIFIGTSSGAGKTTLAAMFCRYLHNQGVKVAPFKGSNLSGDAFITKDGREMGTGQAFQALASGLEPISDMNPVLLKTSGKGCIRLMLNGVYHSDLDNSNPMDVKNATRVACEAFDRLNERFDIVVCEGSGSPAELNMKERDIANLGMMRERNISAVLVGDIERGGVFAALYGTWLLIPEELRPNLKGFIINRFRGDPGLLGSGIERIEELTGMKFMGIVPFVDLRFPEEDALSIPVGNMDGLDAEKVFIENLDRFIEMSVESGLDLEGIRQLG